MQCSCFDLNGRDPKWTFLGKLQICLSNMWELGIMYGNWMERHGNGRCENDLLVKHGNEIPGVGTGCRYRIVIHVKFGKEIQGLGMECKVG